MAEDSEIELDDSVDDNWKRENLDLYDDVESHSNSDTPKETKLNSQNNYSGRRIATYVGNLRWWTTDQDLLDVLNKMEIKDVLEIKFHENRQNGQSKGFCVVVFGSDKSSKDAIDKLPKTEIHGLAPIVTYCNKQNLNYFEQAAGGGSSTTSNNNSNNNNNNQNNNQNNGNKLRTDLNRNNGQSMIVNNNSQMQIGSLGNTMRFTGNMTMPGMSGINQNLLFNLSQQYSNNMTHPPNMMIQNPISTSLNVQPGHMNMNMSLAAQRLIQPTMMMQPGINIGTGTGPTPHLNPHFFNGAPPAALLNNMAMSNPALSSGIINNQQFDAFGRPIVTNNNNSFATAMISKLSDTEFDEILQRNKTVSSSAINRAVQDASAGDYASAIETLVTAISLIKQSKIAADNRCKVLINSLQDTLTGIESKSYGSRRNKTRRRSYSDHSSSDDCNTFSGSSSRRVLRSRSRDRRRRSRDCGHSGAPTASTSKDCYHGVKATSSSDRYATKYRH